MSNSSETPAGAGIPWPCPACGQLHQLPQTAPPTGTCLLCRACGQPLVAMPAEAGGAPMDTLWRLFGYQDCCLVNLSCPWCQAANRAVVVPANCRFGGSVLRQASPDPAAYQLEVACGGCERPFVVVW